MATNTGWVDFNEGAAPSTPAAGKVRLYPKTDGLLYSKDDAGAETLVSGGAGGGAVATDTIWDAAGDLAVGSGSNTAAKLSIGATNGMALQRVSGAVAWALPQGHQFDYVEITSNVSITATTEATANTAITGSAVTYDGSTVILVEFFSASSRPDSSAAGRTLDVWLYDGSSSIGELAYTISQAANAPNVPIYAARRLTPSAAAHTYSIRASVSAGTGAIGAGAGGTGNMMPAFIRITKIA